MLIAEGWRERRKVDLLQDEGGSQNHGHWGLGTVLTFTEMGKKKFTIFASREGMRICKQNAWGPLSPPDFLWPPSPLWLVDNSLTRPRDSKENPECRRQEIISLSSSWNDRSIILEENPEREYVRPSAECLAQRRCPMNDTIIGIAAEGMREGNWHSEVRASQFSPPLSPQAQIPSGSWTSLLPSPSSRPTHVSFKGWAPQPPTLLVNRELGGLWFPVIGNQSRFWLPPWANRSWKSQLCNNALSLTVCCSPISHSPGWISVTAPLSTVRVFSAI